MRLLVPLLLVAGLFAQAPQDAPKKGGGRGMGPPKNLKVLKPDVNIRQVMMGFTVGLGVKCDYCHIVAPALDFASDENPKKEIARRMIKMAEDANATFGDSKEHVTCYTCHRGETLPKTAPPPAAPAQ